MIALCLLVRQQIHLHQCLRALPASAAPSERVTVRVMSPLTRHVLGHFSARNAGGVVDVGVLAYLALGGA